MAREVSKTDAEVAYESEFLFGKRVSRRVEIVSENPNRHAEKVRDGASGASAVDGRIALGGHAVAG
jgi:hypothetical protein